MVTWQEIDDFTQLLDEPQPYEDKGSAFKTLITRIIKEGLIDEHEKQVILSKKDVQFIDELTSDYAEQVEKAKIGTGISLQELDDLEKKVADILNKTKPLQKFEVHILNSIPTFLEAESRLDVWKELEGWLYNQIELIGVKKMTETEDLPEPLENVHALIMNAQYEDACQQFENWFHY